MQRGNGATVTIKHRTQNKPQYLTPINRRGKVPTATPFPIHLFTSRVTDGSLAFAHPHWTGWMGHAQNWRKGHVYFTKPQSIECYCWGVNDSVSIVSWLKPRQWITPFLHKLTFIIRRTELKQTPLSLRSVWFGWVWYQISVASASKF